MPNKILVALFLAGLAVSQAWAAPQKFYSQGLSALKSGNTASAISLLTKAISEEPSNHRFYNDRGIAYRRIGELDKAVQDYTKALDIKPDYVNALNNRGVAYIEKREFEKAVRDLTQALKSTELEGKVRGNLGLALAGLGNYEQAAREFQAAAEKETLDAPSLKSFGLCQFALGNKDAALVNLKKALRNADHNLAQEVKQKIDEIERGGNPVQALTRPAPVTAAKPSPATENREIVLAKPKSAGPTAQPKEIPKVETAKQETGADSPGAFSKMVRSRAIQKLSGAAVQVYTQGSQFLEQAGLQKALVRFEDVLQMERINRNNYGLAWINFEIGRVQNKLGDYGKAQDHLAEAYKSFEKLGATDESILTMFEYASSFKALGQNDKSKSLHAKAVQLAQSRGYSQLAANLDPQPPAQPKARSANTSGVSPVKNPPTTEQAKHDSEPPKAPAQKPAPAPITAAVEGSSRTHQEQSRETPKNDGAVGEAQAVIRLRQSSTQGVSSQTNGKQLSRGRIPILAGSPKLIEVDRAPVNSQNVQGPNADVNREKDAAINPLIKPVESASRAVVSPTPPKAAPEKIIPVDRKTLSKDLKELRRLKDRNDEYGMSATLERIAETYSKHKDYEKASMGYAAALAFREKLGVYKGIEYLYQKCGLANEERGDLAGAMEAYSRAMSLSNTGAAKLNKDLEAQIRKLASGLGVDPDSLINGYRQLWEARRLNDAHNETQALYVLATVYEKYNRTKEAIHFYERATASLMADKAGAYEKQGNAALARTSYEQALEAFKTLDYARYLELRRKVPNS
jgi:tetratricopeptide (TPR) repeat protein